MYGVYNIRLWPTLHVHSSGKPYIYTVLANPVSVVCSVQEPDGQTGVE